MESNRKVSAKMKPATGKRITLVWKKQRLFRPKITMASQSEYPLRTASPRCRRGRHSSAKPRYVLSSRRRASAVKALGIGSGVIDVRGHRIGRDDRIESRPVSEIGGDLESVSLVEVALKHHS